jgi:uncharacterized protein YerC
MLRNTKMARPASITQATEDFVVRALKAGALYKDIAAHAGISMMSVTRIAQKHGLSRKTPIVDLSNI